jgi:hypothetical protein
MNSTRNLLSVIINFIATLMVVLAFCEYHLTGDYNKASFTVETSIFFAVIASNLKGKE